MTTAQAAVKAYVASGNAYLACMQPALDSADTPAEQKAVLTAEYNAAVDEMQAVAASWKAAVSAFKAK
jgi:truncated hemoglobin YjbI